jgi:hypothetical protein
MVKGNKVRNEKRRKSYSIKTFPINGAYLSTLSLYTVGFVGAYTAWGMTHDQAVENVMTLAAIKQPDYGTN